MTNRKYEPLSEERRAALRREPGVIHRRRAEVTPTPFVSEIRVTGDINTLELLGRVDGEESAHQNARGTAMTDTARQRVNISSGTPWEERVGYSRAVRIGNLIYTSGTTAMKEGALVGINDPYAQTVQILDNIRWALGETGATMADVVRYRVYLVDIDDWTAVARALKEIFGAVRPCSTLLAVAALIDPAMRVEIEVDAVAPPT